MDVPGMHLLDEKGQFIRSEILRFSLAVWLPVDHYFPDYCFPNTTCVKDPRRQKIYRQSLGLAIFVTHTPEEVTGRTRNGLHPTSNHLLNVFSVNRTIFDLNCTV